MANTCPALEHLGIDCESVDLHHPSLRPLWGLIFRQEDERPAMMCYELEGAYRGHNGPDAESELMTRLFDALGLHVSRSSLWSCVPNQQRSAVAIKKEPGRRSKHARLGSSRHSLLVTNFPLSGSHFYCGGLAFKETTSDFTFNPSNVIEAPPVQLPSEKTRDTRAKVPLPPLPCAASVFPLRFPFIGLELPPKTCVSSSASSPRLPSRPSCAHNFSGPHLGNALL